MKRSRPDETPRTTVYYDGSCPLCTTEINHYASRDDGDALSFHDVSQGTALGDDLTPRDAMRRFHVRLQDGTLVSGAQGFVALWERLPGWRWAARAARVPGVLPVLELGYRLFLPVRPALSKIAHMLGAKPASAAGGARAQRLEPSDASCSEGDRNA